MQTFIDAATITIKAGDGGDGRVSFRHLKYIPKGGPDGGDGGKGGSVYMRANQSLNTLYQFRHKRKYVASSGEQGGKSDKTGLDGEDLYIEVPVGTIIQYSDNKIVKDREISIEMLSPGQTVLLAEGGRGGRGNRNFATPRVQAPRKSTPGIKTDTIEISLELKLLADIGLVGLPNAGKSTFLSLVSSAKPRIANYPFTTLEPNLGVAVYDDISVVVADIPGLIEGASEGKGLGDAFLKHVERTSVLLHLVSLDSSEGPLREQFNTVRNELHQFNEALSDKPYIIVLSKSDLVEESALAEARDAFSDLSSVEIMASSVVEIDQARAVLAKAVEMVSKVRSAEQLSEIESKESSTVATYTVDNLRHTFRSRSR